MTRKHNILLTAAVASFVATACMEQKPKQSGNTANTAEQSAVADTTTNDNNKPLFDDPAGELDSLYKANNYVYTSDLQKAVEEGDKDATQLLASMYAYGIGGVEADRKKAYLLYRNLAESGDAEAQANLGYMMVYGVGPVEDAEAGMEWLEKSANQRCPMAFYYLGNYFEQTGDIKNAKTCYKNAIALGMSQAQVDLDNLK